MWITLNKLFDNTTGPAPEVAGKVGWKSEHPSAPSEFSPEILLENLEFLILDW
jgi:hypothetical protein